MTVKSPFWPLNPLTPGNPENPCKPVSKSFSNSPQEAGPARVRVRPEEHTCSPLCPVCPGDPVSPLGPGAPGAPEVPRIPRSPSGPGRPLILTGGPQEQSPWLPATNRSTTVMHGRISQQTFAAGRQENNPLSAWGRVGFGAKIHCCQVRYTQRGELGEGMATEGGTGILRPTTTLILSGNFLFLQPGGPQQTHPRASLVLLRQRPHPPPPPILRKKSAKHALTSQRSRSVFGH